MPLRHRCQACYLASAPKNPGCALLGDPSKLIRNPPPNFFANSSPQFHGH